MEIKQIIAIVKTLVQLYRIISGKNTKPSPARKNASKKLPAALPSANLPSLANVMEAASGMLHALRRRHSARPLSPAPAPAFLPARKARRALRFPWLGVLAAFLGGCYGLARLNRGQLRRRARREWADAACRPLQDAGSTFRLEILPLIDRNTSRPDLLGEAGVSYLVRTDHINILFDLGLNAPHSEPSPLVKNMHTLGLTLDDFDAVVISHNHSDHVGGLNHQVWKTFGLSRTRYLPLTGKPVYAPTPLQYPGTAVSVCSQPHVISPGVVLMGILPFEPYYPRAYFAEQSLGIRVAGRGVVVITGCGHPGLARILSRANDLFSEPVAGVVGGLHYYDDSFTAQAVNDVRWLKPMRPQLLAVSGHDCTPVAMQVYREAFPDVFQEVLVGKAIRFSA